MQRLGVLARSSDPSYSFVSHNGAGVAGRQEILDMLRRRPCSVEDIAHGLGLHVNEVIKHVEELSAQKLVEQSLSSGKCYYRTVE